MAGAIRNQLSSPVTGTRIRSVSSAIGFIFLSPTLVARAGAPEKPTGAQLMEALWHGNAHFEQIADIQWGVQPYNSPHETSAWVTVHDNTWYVFNMEYLHSKTPGCFVEHTRIVARKSTDHGATWSEPTVMIDPKSPSGNITNR